MQSSRRGFMKLLGGLPIVGPSIAKEAVNLDVLKIPLNAKIPFGNGTLNDSDYDHCVIKNDTGSYDKMDHIKEQLLNITRKSKLLKKEGLPKWMKQQWDIEYSCKNFDPDLAVNRSMSLVAKLHIQRERDWKRFEYEELNQVGIKMSYFGEIFDMNITNKLKKLFPSKDDGLYETSKKYYKSKKTAFKR